MNKLICAALCILLVLSLCACGGKTNEVKMPFVQSQLYAQDDISKAINTITEEFNKEWRGCTLTEIYYAGDDVSEKYQDWADRHSADEVIVLLSSFDVDSSGGDGSLNSDSTYKNWNWILVRTHGGEWIHVDHGY